MPEEALAFPKLTPTDRTIGRRAYRFRLLSLSGPRLSLMKTSSYFDARTKQ